MYTEIVGYKIPLENNQRDWDQVGEYF